jgi:TonB family protein
MNKPHLFTRLFLLIAAIVCAFALCAATGHKAYAQQPDTRELYDTAERDYEAGDYRKALDVIEGLLKTEPDYAPALSLKYKALIGLFVNTPPQSPDAANSPDARRERKIGQAKLLKEAADSLEKFLQLKPDVTRANELRDQLNSLRVYAEPAIKPESEWTVFSTSEVTQKAHILRRTEPRYPEEARAARITGKVKLLAVFAADGTVKHILVLESPSHWLTEASIKAARNISFEPAIKDGHPVATAHWIEYGFETY